MVVAKQKPRVIESLKVDPSASGRVYSNRSGAMSKTQWLNHDVLELAGPALAPARVI